MVRLSGNWTLTAIEKLAGWDQRIVIAGSANADGVYLMIVGSVVADVNGVGFEVRSQALNSATGEWLDSFQREVMTWDPVKGVVMTILVDDHTDLPDQDYNDLIVECRSSDRELAPPPFNGPRLDLTIPEQHIRHRVPLDQRAKI